MIIIMEKGHSPDDIAHVNQVISSHGYRPHIIQGAERTVVAAVGDGDKTPLFILQGAHGVESVVPVMAPYKLVGRESKSEDTIVDVRGVRIGGNQPLVIMAGPCAVESEEQILATARAVKAAGASILRGGAYKPRTSPHSFQGMEEEGLKLLAKAREETGLKIVTEVIEPSQVELVASYADMLQIGARNMQNFALLRAVGRAGKPVLLKRGMAGTIKELLMSAEYICAETNYQVALCERGIRTFETETRNTLDLSAVPVLKRQSHLPVIVDPSHGTGYWGYVAPMAAAAVAAGCDGLMVEVHPVPEEAVSDGRQSLRFEKFEQMMKSVRAVAQAVGREVLQIN